MSVDFVLQREREGWILTAEMRTLDIDDLILWIIDDTICVIAGQNCDGAMAAIPYSLYAGCCMRP